MPSDVPLRIEKLKKTLSKLSVDALLIETPIDIFYLTGCNVSTGTLLVSEARTSFIVDGRYYDNCTASCSLEVLLADDLTVPTLVEKDKIKILGIDSNTTTVSRLEKIKSSLPKTTILPLHSPVSPLRIIKDPSELDSLREAAKLGSEGYDYALTLLKPGVSEREVAAELEIFWLRKGGDRLAFDPIIAFGPNTALPHYRAGDARLQINDNVLIDIGVVKNKYHSDMTRVKFIGKVQDELHCIYALVHDAQETALSKCKAGVTAGELDAAARDLISADGYGAYFSHSLGHGVGLQIHEDPFLRNKPPFSSFVLEAGMVITIEPGIYLPGIGGVRLENTVIITADGYEDLTLRDVTNN